MNLKSYLDRLTVEARSDFATACGTTCGHLKNIAYGYRPCSVELAAAIERKTKGELSAEGLAPHAAETIAYLKSNPHARPVADSLSVGISPDADGLCVSSDVGQP